MKVKVKGSLLPLDSHHVHLWGDSDGVASNGGPPDHQVGVEGDPDDRPKEGDREELPSWKRENENAFNENSVMYTCDCLGALQLYK